MDNRIKQSKKKKIKIPPIYYYDLGIIELLIIHFLNVAKDRFYNDFMKYKLSIN